jgi:hypothetical protein
MKMRPRTRGRIFFIGREAAASVHSVNSTLNHGLALLAHRARRGANRVKNVEKRRPLAAFKAG